MRSSLYRRPRLWLERLEARLAPTFGPIGPEFHVNTYTTNGQSVPQVAADSDGDFVIVWQSNGQDGSGDGVYAQRNNSAGTPLGGEFRVNTCTTSNQSVPAVAMNAAGDFVIVWQSNGQDDSADGVYAQRYSSAGTPLGGEFRVNTYTTDVQFQPAVAMNASGDFVVAWTSYGQDGSGFGVYAQRYSAAGAPLGGEFRVNTYTTLNQSAPAVAMDAAGDFVVAWHSYLQDVSSFGVYAQRYSSAGAPLGGEFRVNTYTTSFQGNPTVGTDADGDFVVAWQSNLQDGNGYGVYAQRFSAFGTPQGSEFRINTYTTSFQARPTVAMDADGDFVVAWESNLQDVSSFGVYAQRHSAAGIPLGGEFRINTYTTSLQGIPTVGTDADGDFVIAWTSLGQEAPGTYGIYAQRYTDFDDNGDTAGPIVTSVRPTGASQPIVAGGVLVSTPSQLTVAFSEAMSVSGAGSVMATANWQLARYGTVVPGAVTGITFGLSTATNQYEAVVSFNAALADGRYTLTALPTMTDAAGNALDGIRDGTPGDAYSLTFDVKPVTPRGPETQVNSFTTGSQSFPSVAVDATGNTVVVWSSTTQDGSSYGVYARRYDAAGATLGSEFRVNTFTTGSQRNPAVAMSPAGDFVVVWQSAGQDGSSYGVYAQRYSADGTPRGTEFGVNVFSTSFQHLPVVAMNAAGDFVVAWSSVTQDGDGSGIYSRRYNAAGAALSSEFRVNTFTTSNQTAPSIGMSAAGDFVVAWDSYEQDGSSLSIYAQRYSASGIGLGSEFRVNTFTTGIQGEPAVGVGAAGDFVIVWVDEQGVNGQDIFAQRYSAGGTPIGTEFLVNVTTTGSQVNPSVAVGASGGFVISWQDAPIFSDSNIDARRYDASGTPVTNVFHVSSYATGEQSFPSVATDAQGDIVVVWASGVPVGVGQDGDRYGIYTQRYVANLTPTTSGLPNIVIPPNPTSNVNLAAGFNDIEDGAAGLIYTVVGNTNPAAFISLVITGSTLTIWPGTPGASTLTIRATDSGGAFVETSFTVTIAGAAPQIAQTLVNGSAGAQRSWVTSIEMTFTNQVSFAGVVASAFSLSRAGGGPVTFTATANIVAGATVVTLNAFTGPETENGSLRDGRYTLTAFAAQISVGGILLDGNGDGTPGDDYTFGDAQGLFRFYGDMNGDRRVDISDFGFFSLAYLTPANYNAALDFNNDGRIDIADFGQFSVRFFTRLP